MDFLIKNSSCPFKDVIADLSDLSVHKTLVCHDNPFIGFSICSPNSQDSLSHLQTCAEQCICNKKVILSASIHIYIKSGNLGRVFLFCLGIAKWSSYFHRDIYYNNTQLFGSQTTVDNIVDDISCMLKIPRRSLHVVSVHVWVTMRDRSCYY